MSEQNGAAAVDQAAATITQTQHDQAVAAARTAGEEAGRSAGLAEGRKEGATAERARIAGIRAAALPGHEKLVQACIDDPDCTPGDAALKINAAEKAKLAAAAGAIRDVERDTGKVPPAPAADRRDEPPAAQSAVTVDGMKAEYAASAQLQAEFPTEAIYIAQRKAELGGNVRILERKRG